MLLMLQESRQQPLLARGDRFFARPRISVISLAAKDRQLWH
jgi:hypothetical protein